MDNPSEKICEECGKQFSVPSARLWAYKIVTKQNTEWFCRYNCVRSAERKHDAKKGRKKELKSKRPSKEVLEKDLMLGLPIVQIAKKHDGSVQSVHNWIKSYGLAGIQGKKKDVASVAPVAEVVDKYGPFLEGTDVDEMVQESPTLNDIEQFHTNELIQELPKVEFDPPKAFANIQDSLDAIHQVNHPEDYETCNDHEQAAEEYNPDDTKITAEPDPIPEKTLAEIWENVKTGIMAAQRKHAEQADKDFRSQLLQLVLAVTNGRGIAL